MYIGLVVASLALVQGQGTIGRGPDDPGLKGAVRVWKLGDLRVVHARFRCRSGTGALTVDLEGKIRAAAARRFLAGLGYRRTGPTTYAYSSYDGGLCTFDIRPAASAAASRWRVTLRRKGGAQTASRDLTKELVGLRLYTFLPQMDLYLILNGGSALLGDRISHFDGRRLPTADGTISKFRKVGGWMLELSRYSDSKADDLGITPTSPFLGVTFDDPKNLGAWARRRG